MSPKIDKKFDLDLVPDPVIAKQMGVTLMTLYRWTKESPELGFPKVVKIKTRNYRVASELTAWRDKMVRGGAKKAVRS